MTRKDYKKIAKVMNDILNDNAEPIQWLNTVAGLAQVLKEDNPRFDLHKFRNACGWITCTGVASERT